MVLAPPPPGQGIQLRMTSTIAAGMEIERCQFVQAPPEGLNINHQDVQYTPGSHHVLLYLTPYTSIPTVDINGVTHDTSGVVDCALGATADWKVSNILGGAQSTNGGSLVSLPPGVAVKVPPNAILLINTHYLNASQQDLLADARINLYTIPDDQVQQEGGVLFFYNPFIYMDAQSQSSARMRCPIKSDITLTNIQSHMHRRAVNYVANLLDANANLDQMLYTNTDWQNVPVKQFDPGLSLKTGDFLDYHCDYNNMEQRTIIQGPATTDEMCMLIGSYYPRDDSTAFCEDATFVGSGTTSCGESLKCATTALLTGDNASLYSCVVNSCPNAATQLTAALKCIFTQNGGQCTTACQDPTASACTSCIVTGCQPASDSCSMAQC